MSCNLCGSEKFTEILNKPDVCIWTNANDNENNKKRMHKCLIYQCKDCGHVYQPVDEGLRSILKEIYLSDNAQASTPHGKGNWGLERCKIFLNKIDFKDYKSVIEIGCAGGYLLRCLKARGFKKLVGIDPSIGESKTIDGILFLKDFADEKLRLSQKYDLIFSEAVFEHIEKIHDVINFCINNLKEEGELFFSVPNAQKDLENGDPGLFLHQHINHFTERSLRYLLERSGFEIKSIISMADSLSVSAKIKTPKTRTLSEIVFYTTYQKRLDKALIKFKTILRSNKTIVHGANNTLNNILGWLNDDFDFVLVDNDNTKQGKRYFNRMVHSMIDIELKKYDTVLIVPRAYHGHIEREYIRRGFKGAIESILSNKNIT